jgi:hypothetical protein
MVSRERLISISRGLDLKLRDWPLRRCALKFLDILEETDRNQYSEFSTNQDTFYTLYDNYYYQGNELSTICFYEYYCQIQVDWPDWTGLIYK